MQLIFNADDFGLSRGVNLGIIEAFRNGVVRSATLMANMNGFRDAVQLSSEHPELGVGIHLCLTAGQPLTLSKELRNKQNTFHRDADIISSLSGEMVEAEFVAQIEHCLKAGIRPTHLDSHHHVHQLDNISEAFTSVAMKYDLPTRQFPQKTDNIKSTSGFDDSYYRINSDHDISVSHIKDIVSKHASLSSLEIMTHPAFIDQELINQSSYFIPRTFELETLCDSKLIEWLSDQGIELAHFGNL